MRDGRRKRKLYDYAAKLASSSVSSSFWGTNGGAVRAGHLHAVKEMPNERLRAFTAAHPIHEMFEMGDSSGRGDQKLQ